MAYMPDAEEFSQLVIEQERALNKLQDQIEQSQKRFDLRLERQEHAQLQMRGKATGEFARRSDLEIHMDNYDDFESDTKERLGELVKLVQAQGKIIEKLVGRLEVLEVGDA